VPFGFIFQPRNHFSVAFVLACFQIGKIPVKGHLAWFFGALVTLDHSGVAVELAGEAVASRFDVDGDAAIGLIENKGRGMK